jgi:hypothetical protein
MWTGGVRNSIAAREEIRMHTPPGCVSAEPFTGSTWTEHLVRRLKGLARRILIILLILLILYVALGLAFHLKWHSALEACRETRRALGEFVEPEVFGGVLGLLFDVTYWPVYAWANIHHDGTPFATPCTRGLR